MKLLKLLMFLVLGFFSFTSTALGPPGMMRPPAFAAGIPGMIQMQSIIMQRHQARLLLYREALEELHKNPAAADVPECSSANPSQASLCLRPPKIQAETPSIKKIRKYQALLIGNNAYPSPIPKLETPIYDVEKIAEILHTHLGYETQIINDAGKAQIIQAINKIIDNSSPQDSILLFYAGHGLLDDNMGYWLPIDASVKTPENWISNNDIAKLLRAIPANQLILISDSCFSGSLTREQKFSVRSTENFDSIINHRSVIAFSSGDEEPVSDEGKENHSIFAWNLIKKLAKIDSITPGYEVFQVVFTEVKKDAPQSPQYGAVITAGHVSGGEYWFNLTQK